MLYWVQVRALWWHVKELNVCLLVRSLAHVGIQEPLVVAQDAPRSTRAAGVDGLQRGSETPIPHNTRPLALGNLLALVEEDWGSAVQADTSPHGNRPRLRHLVLENRLARCALLNSLAALAPDHDFT